jgi:hypothetical protein
MTIMTDHPDWCGGGHRCGLGEHRSDPERRGLVAGTRIQRPDGRGYLELRATIPLPAGEVAATDRARLAMFAVDLILRVVLTGRLGPLREAYQRLAGATVR